MTTLLRPDGALNLPLWFYDHGVGIFPIVTPGKQPACPSWDDYHCTREQAARFRNYAVRLGSCRDGYLGVLDTDQSRAEAWAMAKVPPTPFVVQTSRGYHRYFRLHGPVDKFIHQDGLTIEFRNAGQYVVGPGSIHPSGVVYVAADWSWQWEDIPFFPTDFVFDDRPPTTRSVGEGFEFPREVHAGERHDQLFRQVRSCKATGWIEDETRWLIHGLNVGYCKPSLREDGAFEQWFRRAWNQKDRPCERVSFEIPDVPLEPNTPVRDLDLETANLEAL